jgi:hypothetical protein
VFSRPGDAIVTLYFIVEVISLPKQHVTECMQCHVEHHAFLQFSSREM